MPHPLQLLRFSAARLIQNWPAKLAVISAALAFLGYLLSDAHQTPPGFWPQIETGLDAVFFTFKIFAGIAPVQISSDIHGALSAAMLHVARFTAPATLIIAFLQSFDDLWKPAWIGWKLRNLTDFDVLFGDSDLVEDFRRANCAENVWSVIVRPANHENGRRQIDGKSRSIWMDLADFQEQSQKNSLAPRALLLIDDTDEANIAAIRDAYFQKLSPKARFFHISDERLRLAMIAQETQGNLMDYQVFSRHELAARSGFRSRDFFLDHVEAGKTRVHLACLGFGDDTLALIAQFLKICWHPDLQPPQVSIFHHNPAELNEMISDRFDALRTLAEITVIEWSETNISTAHFIAQLNETPPTAWYISSDLNARIGRFSLEIRDLVTRAGWAASTVMVPPGEAPILHSGKDAIKIEALAQPASINATQALIGPFDHIARSFHDAWAARTGSDYTSWNDLPENYRASNRRAADGAKTKLEALGVRGPVADALGAALPAAMADPERLEALAKVEHLAWHADRAVNGWRFGPKRDNRAKRHPDMVDWTELSDDIKDLDRLQVQVLSDLLKSKAARPSR